MSKPVPIYEPPGRRHSVGSAGEGRGHLIWWIAGAGIAIRLFLAFHWFGNGDVLTFAIVSQAVLDDPIHFYAQNAGDAALWPYPPGDLAWTAAAAKLSEATGLAFHGVVQLLPILADLALAACVYVYLGWRGRGERARTTAFALVMLGPVFIAISGYHGQIDSMAILPGVLALMVWERRPSPRRAIEAGLLIGVGAVIKTVPLLLLLPLLVTARSRKEGLALIGASLAVVAVVCVPFLIAEPEGFRNGLDYAGAPGRGGLSLIFDPTFAVDRRFDPGIATFGPNGLVEWLRGASGAITLIALAGLTAFLLRYRPAPVDCVVLLWLTIFVFSPHFLLQYLVWLLPFLIMAGYLAESALLQISVVPMLLLTYVNASAYGRAGAIAYVVLMVCLWLVWVVALFRLARREVGSRRSHPTGIQPPLRA